MSAFKQAARRNRCHYCSKWAATVDHIVARVHIKNSSLITMRMHQMNRVPACTLCNTVKGTDRSDCTCPQCREVWETFCKVLPRLMNIPVIRMINAEPELEDTEADDYG